MPSASKYIVDVNKISKPGNVATGGIYIGTGSGNRESLYAVRGTGSGAVVIYDKVLYELSVDNISNIEPNAQTVTFTYSSKRTHGNLTDVDTLGINPTTSAITANHSTASTKTTTCTVNQSVTNNGTLTGNSVNVTVTQIKNYPTGLTLTISPKSTIPAKGGSISSALTNYTYSVTAAYKSGSSSAVTSDSNTTITANVTGVTAASKGTTASTVTTAGTITFTAKYVCNGKTVTTTAAVNITQDKNEVVSYANPTFTITPSSNQTLPASGGSVTAAVSNVQQVRTWSSTSTDTITPTSTTAWTAQTISCNSRGTVTGGTLTLGTTTATVTANGKSTSKSYVVYQEANAITAYSKPTGLSLSCADIPASGGTVTAATGGTVSQTRTYTSKATDTINPTVTITWNPAQTATANSLGTTDKTRTKITTLTATYSANGQSNSTSVDVYQQANGHTDSWNNPVVTITYATFSAAGETKTPTTCSATQSGTRTWTSGSQTGITNTSFTWGNYSMTNGTGFTLQNAETGAVKADSRGTTTGAARSNNTIRRTATGAGSKQGTGSGTVTQEANAESTTWGDLIITSASLSCGPIPVTGGTVYPSTGGTVYQNRRRTYTSGEHIDDTPSITASVSYNPTSVTGASNIHSTTSPKRGTVTATWTGNSSKQASKSVDVYQTADSYVYVSTTTTTTFTIPAGNTSVTGGTKTFTFNRTNTYTYKWNSDSATFTTEDHTGTTTVASSNAACTLSKTTNVSNGDSITATWSSNIHTTSDRSSTLSAGVGGASGTLTQNKDTYSYRSTDVLTDWSTEDSSNIPTGGGSRTAKWWTTRYHYYYWDSDDAYYTTTTDNEGTANLTATGGTLNRSTITNGQSVTITVGSSSSQRTVKIHEDVGGKDISWTQEGQSLLTPTINSVSISFASDPEPTPTIGTLSIQLQNPTNKTIYIALSTNGEASGIVASGSMSPNNGGTLFTYKPTSKTQRLYCLIKASGSLNNYFGVGTGPQWGYWIDGVSGSGTAKSVVVSSSWQKITSSATYLPTGNYTEWGSYDTNVPFFFANA